MREASPPGVIVRALAGEIGASDRFGRKSPFEWTHLTAASITTCHQGKALRRRIQGTVVLEAIVRRDGCPSHIRVLQSLDPGGLDENAVAAAEQWRFEPGRFVSTPVDVVVTISLDFRIW